VVVVEGTRIKAVGAREVQYPAGANVIRVMVEPYSRADRRARPPAQLPDTDVPSPASPDQDIHNDTDWVSRSGKR
jgi:hypothetical protein